MLVLVYYLAYLSLYKNYRKLWDIFTRIISTLNALNCIYMIYYELFQSPPNKLGMLNLYYVASDYSLKTLFQFSHYLLVDGTFQIPDIGSFQTLLSILHHFVGGIGIYMIADNKMGFYLGFYFAMTEISTPFLNLSWFFRYKRLFLIFYIFFFLSRIVTIPFLLEYLSRNTEYILTLPTHQNLMCFYASYALIMLNVIWFIFMTKKLFV